VEKERRKGGREEKAGGERIFFFFLSTLDPIFSLSDHEIEIHL
jgi:hypothetical protein